MVLVSGPCAMLVGMRFCNSPGPAIANTNRICVTKLNFLVSKSSICIVVSCIALSPSMFTRALSTAPSEPFSFPAHSVATSTGALATYSAPPPTSGIHFATCANSPVVVEVAVVTGGAVGTAGAVILKR